MADKSKFFRVAVEGATTDGRAIERQWILDIVETYAPATYAARMNMEHIRGYSAEPPFCAYGDVLAVKSEEITLTIGGKAEKRLALYAQLSPTEELKRINGKGQKLYSSIEVSPNFANTGKAYLMGLAVTDTPASLGTELLQFAATSPAVKAALDAKKKDPANLFTAAVEEFSLELEAEPVLTDPNAATFAGLLQAALAKFTLTPAAPPVVATPAPVASPSPGGQGGDFASLSAALTAGMTAMAQGFDSARAQDRAEFTTFKGEFAALKAKLDGTAQHSQRPASTGAADIQLAEY